MMMIDCYFLRHILQLKRLEALEKTENLHNFNRNYKAVWARVFSAYSLIIE
jgi:hypothetical protein